jgi:hypothetical protein
MVQERRGSRDVERRVQSQLALRTVTPEEMRKTPKPSVKRRCVPLLC